MLIVNKMSSTQPAIKISKAPKTVKKSEKKEKSVSEEKKITIEEKPALAPAPVPVAEPAEDVSVCSSKPLSVQEKINLQIGSVSSMIKTLKGIEGSLKEATKTIQKESKGKKRVLSQEEKEKRRTTSGFNKPTPISKELASFMGLSEGAEASRVDVTRSIISYIKEHNLQDGRQFKVDDKLKALLGDAVHPINSKQPELGMGYTYFNVPSYMKRHFLKKE